MTKNKNAGTYARLDDTAEQAVSNLMSEKGLTKSSAVNTIIREWAEMRKNFITIPIKGAVVDGGKITIEEELARR